LGNKFIVVGDNTNHRENANPFGIVCQVVNIHDMNKIIVSIGILIQLYLIFALTYSGIKTDEFPDYQSLFHSFWPILDSSYNALLFVFIISLVIIFTSIYALTKSSQNHWKWLIVLECIFTGYISLGLM